MKSLRKAPFISSQVWRDRLSTALEQAVTLNPFAEIVEPVSWQREQRQDCRLPGRDDVDG